VRTGRCDTPAWSSFHLVTMSPSAPFVAQSCRGRTRSWVRLTARQAWGTILLAARHGSKTPEATSCTSSRTRPTGTARPCVIRRTMYAQMRMVCPENLSQPLLGRCSLFSGRGGMTADAAGCADARGPGRGSGRRKQSLTPPCSWRTFSVVTRPPRSAIHEGQLVYYVPGIPLFLGV